MHGMNSYIAGSQLCNHGLPDISSTHYMAARDGSTYDLVWPRLIVAIWGAQVESVSVAVIMHPC